MYDAKTLRGKRDAKARKMAGGDPHKKVDASSWTPPEPLNADIKTGMRPISRRAFKSGGAATEYVNRDVKAANEDRPGIKHVGGMKKGGRAKKQDGGPMVDPAMVAAAGRAGVPADRLGFAPAAPSQGVKKFLGLKRGGKAWEGSAKDRAEDKRMAKARGMSMAEWEKSDADKKHDRKHRATGGSTVTDLTGVRPTGGRTAKAGGGKTKGRTNINIVIATGKQQPDMQPPMTAAPPMPGAPPPGLMPPAGGPPPMMPPMGRKAGGRAMRSYKDMTAGALSGEGRLQKTAIAANAR